VADKSTQPILDALSRAVAEPAGVPLFGNKSAPGLFTTTAAARQLAQRCKEEGYLRVLHNKTLGKRTVEICTVTEKGLAHLLSQVSPRQVLEELVRTLEARQATIGELVVVARQWQSGVEGLQVTIEEVLRQIHRPACSAGPAPSGNGSDVWLAAVVAHLAQWQASRASGDCPLPELYRQAQRAAADLTLGHFHDGLRKLHDQARIYLHPWTGPLYEIPEPAYALLIGHEIAYYASLRGQQGDTDKVTA
jgi:hypothetical protein